MQLIESTNDVQAVYVCGMRTHVDHSGRDQQTQQQSEVGETFFIAVGTALKDI